MDKILLEALVEDEFPRIELRGGRFYLHRSETETLEIESPAVPILIVETLDHLPDDESRIDFLLSLIKLAGEPDSKLEALIREIADNTGLDRPF